MMDFMNIILTLLIFVGYFCGVSQGKKNMISQIGGIKSNKWREQIDAEEELASYDEFNCSPSDDSKRTRLDREQWERDAIIARNWLSPKIKKLKKEIVWMENLLSEISE